MAIDQTPTDWASLAADLQARASQGLLRRVEVMDPAAALLHFSSNDYLGLAQHPEVIAALCAGAQQAVGSGASHLLGGQRQAHQDLEQALAAFTGREAALLFGSGYLANLGAVTALLGRHDHIFADRLNHASLVDAALLSRARVQRYRHTDVNHLESLLKRTPAGGRRLIVSDGVFSMDGDIAPLAELAALAQRYGAWLMVDDAHGLGVLGPQGRGSVAAAGLGQDQVPILMGTLGKAFGVYGAFVAGSRVLIDSLVQSARSYIYTTAFPAALASASLAALLRLRDDDWRRERLAAHVQMLQSSGLPLMPSQTPIQPLLLGDNQVALDLSQSLRVQGFVVPAIRPPTVPQGTARLRISLSAAHTRGDVQRLLDALRGA